MVVVVFHFFPLKWTQNLRASSDDFKLAASTKNDSR